MGGLADSIGNPKGPNVLGTNLFNGIIQAIQPIGIDTEEIGARESAKETVMATDEKVVTHLSKHSGYLWQGVIAEQLGWSESKTSRVLSDMESGQRINRYQIGRRKVVCLPHREPEVLQDNQQGPA